MSPMWKICVLVFLNSSVTGILFNAYPRRIQLHGPNISQSLTLSCSLNHTHDVRDIYIIEIGRTFHNKSLPIAQVTKGDSKGAVILDKPNEHRISANGGIEATDPTLSRLYVRLTGLQCEDVTSHYCLVYYVTSSRNGIQEDREEQSVKASDVTLEISRDYTRVGDDVNASVSLHCTFLMPTASLYQLEIGRKTPTSRTSLVLENTTNVYVVDEAVTSRIKVGGIIRSNNESLLTATLSPVVCDDVAAYYCRAVYIVGNVSTSTEDVANVKGSCSGERNKRVTEKILDLVLLRSTKASSTTPKSRFPNSELSTKIYPKTIPTTAAAPATTTTTTTITTQPSVNDIGDWSKGSRTGEGDKALLSILAFLSVHTWLNQ